MNRNWSMSSTSKKKWDKRGYGQGQRSRQGAVATGPRARLWG